MEFSFRGYLDLIRTIKDAGYQITNYQEWERKKYPCILRHDVDFSLERAYDFAVMESENGVFSTYFVLLTTDMYNVFSKESEAIIKDMKQRGHEIGLHYDETRYKSPILNSLEENNLDQILFEKGVLEKIVGAEVKAISMHQPSREFLKSDLKIPGMVNSYSNEFFHKFKYCSDSMRIWHEDIQKDVIQKKFSKLHILTHPIWWSEDEISRDDTLRLLLQAESRKKLLYFHQYYPNV